MHLWIWVTFCAIGKDIDKYLDTFSENYWGLEDGAVFDFNDYKIIKNYELIQLCIL